MYNHYYETYESLPLLCPPINYTCRTSRSSKSSGRNSAPTDYSSLTDSQFLFGSQICQDISQPTSLEPSVQSRHQKNSQQNSQDSDPSIFLKYQSKPYLFSGDSKEKGPLHFAGKSKSILEQFEEDKKKAKDKHDRVFAKGLASVAAHLRLQGIHVYPYLDDWLIRACSWELVEGHTEATVRLISDLGFSINYPKPCLTPTQNALFLGIRLNMVSCLASPLEERIAAILGKVQRLSSVLELSLHSKSFVV
ncbi:interactor of HORMAD1 protein 1 [Ambystoma mexicanum]|uniref:interactor of HORMAD1 protein 1 n=1 Tax=Ambystoma mexicanum TaxID=8296 RepID=UPI0037E8A208